MNLATRYLALKKALPGNREKRNYEDTFGMSRTERMGVTNISAWNKRILAEIELSIKLSEKFGGKYDACIDKALQILEDAAANEGVLANSVCIQAEKELMPLSKEAKEYEVLYVAHAHIDMNWMWGWEETVAATLSTFRTMLNLMKEYPEFTFAQSQASVYQIVEEHDPEMMKEIQERIREGRWEVTANAWVETDKNMPDTESLIRHIAVTRKYLHEHWGIEPDSVKVDFSPDTFGHSRFIPEINLFGNVPYYYHCRGYESDDILYLYRAPSGKEIMMYKEPFWYNSGAGPDNGISVVDIERRTKGLKTALIVYGVGNHGGGVTRRDVECVIEMQKWPVFPRLKFSTLSEYFSKAESVRNKLNVADHELNCLFTGCYSTQSRIKLYNRRAEGALLDAEKMSALANYRLNTPFHAGQFEKGWQKTLFTHFHDIITGSNVQNSREYAMGKLADAIGFAQTELSKAYEAISQNVDTSLFITEEGCSINLSEGAGVGFGVDSYAGVPNPERGTGKTRVYTVFNPSQTDRSEVAEFTVWDYSGNMDSIEVVNAKGENVPFEVVDREIQKYWSHYYFRVLAKVDVPAMGYAVYAIREKEIETYKTFYPVDERVESPREAIVLENEFICARFDTGSGMLHSVISKETGEELLKAPAGLNVIMTQDSSMSAWRIGRYFSMTPVTDTYNVVVRNGKVRKSVYFEQKIMASTVKMTVSLDEGSKNLHYAFEIDWHETCGGQPALPLLSYRLPLLKNADELLTDVPAGFALRKSGEIDVPALSYACPAAEGMTAALVTDCKYGYRLADNVLSVTLINTAGKPDPYPERGIHKINLFVCAAKADAMALKTNASVLIRPMAAVPTAAHEGCLAPVASLLKTDAAHTTVSSVQIAKDGALTVRLFENGGKDDEVTLTLSEPAARAVLTDLDENVLAEAAVKGDKVTFPVPAYTICQVKISK